MLTVVVKTLWLVLIVMSISGCTGIYFNKCKTPDVKYPEMDNSKCMTNECVHDKVLTNYEKLRKYATDLYDANQVCK